MDRGDAGSTEVTLNLKNPARRATVVKELTGELLVFCPGEDPASTVTVTNLATKSKLTVSHPSLASNQVAVAVLTQEQYEKESKAAEKAGAGMEQVGDGIAKAFSGMFGGMMGGPAENRLMLQVKDPQSKVIRIEFVDAAGEAIDTQSQMSMNELRFYDFEKPLPATAKMLIYVASPRSLLRVPFKLADIALP
jgi:hypothetical protein